MAEAAAADKEISGGKYRGLRRENNNRALDVLKRLGCTLHDVQVPGGDLTYFIEYTERAAAFDTLITGGLYKGVSSEQAVIFVRASSSRPWTTCRRTGDAPRSCRRSRKR
jgi:hypothetical protein